MQFWFCCQLEGAFQFCQAYQYSSGSAHKISLLQPAETGK